MHIFAFRSDCQQIDFSVFADFHQLNDNTSPSGANKESAGAHGAVDGIIQLHVWCADILDDKYEIYFCQGSTQLPPTNTSKQCEHAAVIWFLSPPLQVLLPACKMKSFLCCGWQTAQSHWQFFVLLCHRALTSDRWSMAARRLGSKSERA